MEFQEHFISEAWAVIIEDIELNLVPLEKNEEGEQKNKIYLIFTSYNKSMLT